jgi:hypothetical protein
VFEEKVMKNSVSRRVFIKAVGGGLVMSATGSAANRAAETEKPAINRSAVRWGNRPMYLRPYHPTYLVCYYARRAEKLDTASTKKWGPLVARVENEPDLKIYIVDCFDDACAGCAKLCPDALGCMWGVAHTCSSAQDPGMVSKVVEGNKRILSQLGLFIGSQILLKDLVVLLEKNVPVLYDIIGGHGNQTHYAKGLCDLKKKYGL